MINRILLRIKVIQLLYAYYKGDIRNVEQAEEELFRSIEKAYELYFYLLLLVVDLTTYAKDRMERKKQIQEANETDENLSSRFVENRFASQLAINKDLLGYVKKHQLSWAQHGEMIKELYQEITASDYYATYMNDKEDSYRKDKEFWRAVFKKVVAESEMLGKELEEISIYWNDDAETVMSFIIKTIKQFEESNGADQPLMPMFKDEEDREFVRELFLNAIYNEAEYKQLIRDHSKNWELDRLAFMDSVIIQAALAEIHTFPAIPVNVTMNEYIEIAKYYSTHKSSVFVNGILDSVIDKLRKDDKIIKIAYYTPNK